MKALALYTGHDQSVAVIEDGKVILAMEEERPTRIKHTNPSPNPYVPEQGMKWLAEQGHTIDNADLIVYGEPTFAGGAIEPLLPSAGVERERAERLKSKVRCVEHHLSHVALAYAWSGWDDCYALAIDGGGSISYGLAARCRNGVIEEIARDEMTSLTSIMGPAVWYLHLTMALGYAPLDGEGKVTGAAANGNRERFGPLFRSLYTIEPFRVTDPKLPGATRADGTWCPTRESLRELIGVDPQDPSVFYDVAAGGQALFEEMIQKDLEAFIPRGCRLVVSGGAFANVTLNRLLLDWVDELFVVPPMTDSGQSAGAGIYASGSIRPAPPANLYLGYDAGEIPSSVDPREVAKMIADGAVVGLCHGRCEYGPRALGNRSLLADPRRADMPRKLNNMLSRDHVMPFAPAIKFECADEILEPAWRRAAQSAEQMTLALQVRGDWKERIPAVVHVDNTCRPQVLRREVNPFYYDVLDAFYKLTGVGVLLNTSLNLHSQSIVMTERDAVEVLDKGGMNVLVSAGGVTRRA